MTDPALPPDDPIDVERLADCASNDLAQLRELLQVYFETTAEEIENLRETIARGDAATTDRIAHTCAGGSATFGMKAIVPPLRQLEAQARAGKLDDAPALLKEIERQFGLLREIMRPYLN